MCSEISQCRDQVQQQEGTPCEGGRVQTPRPARGGDLMQSGKTHDSQFPLGQEYSMDRNIPEALPAPINSSPSTSSSVHLWTQPSSLQDLICYCISCPYKSIHLVVDFVSFFFNTWITQTLLWLYIQRQGLNITSSGYRVRKFCVDSTLHYTSHQEQ